VKVIVDGLASGDDLARHPVAALSWKMWVARNDSRKRPSLGGFGVPASCEAPLIGSWLQAIWITLRVYRAPGDPGTSGSKLSMDPSHSAPCPDIKFADIAIRCKVQGATLHVN
jgi:hypothetical protein